MHDEAVIGVSHQLLVPQTCILVCGICPQTLIDLPTGLFHIPNTTTGLISLLKTGVAHARPVRRNISKVMSPLIGS